MERMRLAQRERELHLQYAGADGNYDRVLVIVAPIGSRPFTNRRGGFVEHRPAMRRPGRPPARMLPVG